MVRRLSLSFVFEKKKRSPRFLNFFPPPTTTKNARDLRPRAREEYRREEYSIAKRDAALCDEEGMICILRVFSKAFLLREVFFYARVCVFARKILKRFVQQRGASSLSAQARSRASSRRFGKTRDTARRSHRGERSGREVAREIKHVSILSLFLSLRGRVAASPRRFFFFFCAFEYFPRREWCVRVTKCVVGGVKRFSTARKAASRG